MKEKAAAREAAGRKDLRATFSDVAASSTLVPLQARRCSNNSPAAKSCTRTRATTPTACAVKSRRVVALVRRFRLEADPGGHKGALIRPRRCFVQGSCDGGLGTVRLDGRRRGGVSFLVAKMLLICRSDVGRARLTVGDRWPEPTRSPHAASGRSRARCPRDPRRHIGRPGPGLVPLGVFLR
jgi:hypothetical protein